MPRIKRLELFQKRLFQAFVFLIPTQLALHLWPTWSFVFGIRVDYLSPALYLTDLIAILFLTTFLITSRKLSRKLKFLLPLFILSLINIYFSVVTPPTLIKWVKIFLYIVFYFQVFARKGFSFADWVLKPLKLSLIIFGSIAILQFMNQKTIGGFFYWLGERTFTTNTPGIALSSFFGSLKLRPYSTFPHPNALAGYFLVSLILLYFSNNKLNPIDYLVVATSLLTIFLTQSLTVFVVLLIIFLIKVFGKYAFRVNRFLFLSLTAILIAGSLVLPLYSDKLLNNYRLSDDVAKRIVLAKAAGEVFSKHPSFGVGLSNFIPQLPKTSLETQYSWDLQPVHNIFLLLVSETGIFGLLVFFLIVLKICKTKIDDKEIALLAIFMTGFADHYWFTLQQNALLFLLIAVYLFKISLDN